MYPQAELTRLAAEKARLRRQIQRGRAEQALAFHRVLRPVRWLDQVVQVGRKWAPLVAAPLGSLIARTFLGGPKFPGSLLGWASLAFNVWRQFSGRSRENFPASGSDAAR